MNFYYSIVWAFFAIATMTIGLFSDMPFDTFLIMNVIIVGLTVIINKN